MEFAQVYQHIGREIKVARIRKGVKSVDLAKMIKSDASNISAIELGKQGARVSTYLKICSALEIDIKDLFP